MRAIGSMTKRHLSSGTVCYLCGKEIADGQDWDRDHVPPARWFSTAIKQEFNPNLEWLPTHTTCNREYKLDEEYFFNSMLPVALKSPVGRSAFWDLARGFRHKPQLALGHQIRKEFGSIELPGGRRAKFYDGDRVQRVLCKVVRGLFFRASNRVLPPRLDYEIEIVEPMRAPERLPSHPWFAVVRDTEPLSKYNAVFSYKWLSAFDTEIRIHCFSLLLWDSLVVLVRFHDPSCPHCCRP